MSPKRLWHSISDAWRGLAYVFKSEQNFRIQFFLGILALGLAIYFPLRTWELIVIILLVGAVWIMELLNTTFENLTDLLKPRLHHYVFLIKDIMAGAVFLSALLALIIGLIIFLPHLANTLK